MPGKYSTIDFHPHSRELLSVSDDKGIRVCSMLQSFHSLSLTTEDTTKQHFWSPLSGIQIVSHSISNVLSIFDPRSSPTAHMQCATGYQVNRPSHSAFLDDTTVIVSGTTASTRSRSLKLYDLRSPTTPKSVIPFDSSSSPSTSLIPLIDYQRRLAYIVQSHSSSIYAFDFNDPNPVPTTLQLPSTIVGATLLPSTEVDVMRGEINRLFVLTRKDEIIPISVKIERKVCLIESARLIIRVIWTSMPICFLTLSRHARD
jgi:WD40 repeat protein